MFKCAEYIDVYRLNILNMILCELVILSEQLVYKYLQAYDTGYRFHISLVNRSHKSAYK